MSQGLAKIRAALDAQPPYCSGTCEIPFKQSMLFYNTATSGTRKIDLLSPTQHQLESLHAACQFTAHANEHVGTSKGVSACRLDAAAFATQFSLGNSGLADVVGQALFEGMTDRRDIRFELYELNIHSAGSFVRPRKNTAISGKIFGFLDIVFPIPHIGGICTLRNDEREWHIDFATMMSERRGPFVGYAAYFNEVEREIGSIISGHRLMLSYKLYFASVGESSSATISAPGPFELSLKTALAELVNDSKVLPHGGYLAFGLRHQYSVSSGMRVDTLRSCLKGSDAIVTRVLDRLNLPWSLRVLYRDGLRGCYAEQTFVLYKFISDLSQRGLMWSHWGAGEKMGPGAEFVRFVDEFGNDDEKRAGDYDKQQEDVVDIIQVTEIPSVTNLHSQYLAYGNEVTTGNLFGDICLVAEVPAKVPRLP